MVNSMSDAQRRTAARAVARLDAGGRVSHKPKGQPYAFGCNRESMRDAARLQDRGVVGIDLDIHPNAQQTPFVHHQKNPTKRDAWFDPNGAIGDHDSCTELRDSQMRRLRVKYQGKNRPILTAHQAAVFALGVKGGPLIPCFEAKLIHPEYFDPQWWFDEFVKGWDSRLQPTIMALPGTQGGKTGLRKLAAAHEVGLPTVWLWRGNTPITRTKGFKDAVDLVKSRPGRGIYRV
jgi:hypothetical protein